MTPAARVQTAIELLDQILDGAPAEKVLTGWARKSRFAGSKDRAAVRDHVYDVLRRKRSVLPKNVTETGRALMLGVLLQDEADTDVLFSGDGYGPGKLTPDESQITRADLNSDQVDLPDWIQPLLQNALAEDFEGNATAMRERAPVFLRVNLKKSTRQAAIERLKSEGVESHASPLADTGLEVTFGARRVQNSKTYQEGWVEIQDASSQAAISTLPLKDGLSVLDYCAGGGGKTLAMAARMDGSFFAYDAFPQRLRDLPARADRAGVSVEILEENQLSREPGFDVVFCDVPCSGSGTWRRTPDAKWRFAKSDLETLVETQATILDKASRLCSESGTLVFATCSMLLEENENQIETFLKNSPEWTCHSMQRWQMTNGCDGFFMAQLNRRT